MADTDFWTDPLYDMREEARSAADEAADRWDMPTAAQLAAEEAEQDAPADPDDDKDYWYVDDDTPFVDAVAEPLPNPLPADFGGGYDYDEEPF